MTETKRQRRWLRYSLRTLLAIMFVWGVVFALVARHAHQRKSALAAVRNNGGRLVFNTRAKPTWMEKLLGNLFGPEVYQPVRSINMLTGGFRTEESRRKLPDDFLAKLSALSELQDLGLENTIIASDDWPNIARSSHVWQVMLSSSNITDDGIRYVSQLPKLEVLDLMDLDGITDAAMVWLARLPKLDNLNVANSKITDQGLRQFHPVAPLTILQIRSNNITSEGVESLTHIPTLRQVALGNTKIDDKALDELATLLNLTTLSVVGTLVTPDGVQRFRELRPRCTVTGP